MSRLADLSALPARLPFIAVFVLIVVLSAITATGMDRGGLSPDGRENVRLSFNLWTTGSFSEGGEQPSYYREPLPVIVTAATMALFTDIPETATEQQLANDYYYTQQILQVNLFYLVALFFAVWWLAWLLTKSHIVGALAVAGTWGFLATIQNNTTNLLTENPGALTLVLATGALVRLVQTKGLGAAALAGVTLGAFALTKAAGLYVAIVAVPIVSLSLALVVGVTWRKALGVLVVTGVAFSLTVAPWMTRNYIHFGEFTLTERGGIVLYTRAVKDNMTAEEYGGSFYAYSSPAVRRVFESLLGFQREDLRPGGRYERLIRYPPGEVEVVMDGRVEEAVSYFGKSWAMKVRLEEQMRAAGLPEGEADRVLQERASNMIAAAPGRHIAATLPFAWRGMWSFSGRDHLGVAAANFVSFAALLALPFIALWRRRVEWLALSVVGVGIFWFHALATHFIPRYSQPMIPLTVLAVLVLLHALAVHWKRLRSAS